MVTLSAVRDLLTIGRRYLSDEPTRLALRAVVTAVPVSPIDDVLDAQTAEETAAPQDGAARPPQLPPIGSVAHRYSSLASTSLALSRSAHDGATTHLNALFLEIRPEAMFAGVKTALETAGLMAEALDVPLRIVLLQTTGLSRDDAAHAASVVQQHVRSSGVLPSAVEVTVLSESELPDTTFGKDDFWLATHWSTAHALDVSVRAGGIRPECVGYLIQDYEPGFNPWSTEFAVARSSYHADFLPIVNSRPLADYLRETEGLSFDDSLVFSPSFDLPELEGAASGRASSGTPRVFFYSRPSKPRNLYNLGIAALRVAAARLKEEGLDAEFVAAGEPGPDIDLADGMVLKNLGALNRAEYFELLATTDVGLSLQYSPHPSHPPFDLAISGALSITNAFAGRAPLHPNQRIAAADADSLAAAVVAAVREAHSRGTGSYVPDLSGSLGQALFHVAQEAARALRLRAARSAGSAW
jgi:hypothetical protein